MWQLNLCGSTWLPWECLHRDKHYAVTTPHPPHKHRMFTTPPSIPCTSSQTSHVHHTMPPFHTLYILTSITHSLHHTLLHYTFTTPSPPPHPAHPHKHHIRTLCPPPYTVPPYKHVHYTMPSSIHCTSSQTPLFHALLHTLYLLTNMYTTPCPPPYTVPPHMSRVFSMPICLFERLRDAGLCDFLQHTVNKKTEFCNPKMEQLKWELCHVTLF